MHEVTVDPSHSDSDPQETAEWRDAFTALVATHGPKRARFVLNELAHQARIQRVGWKDSGVCPLFAEIVYFVL